MFLVTMTANCKDVYDGYKMILDLVYNQAKTNKINKHFKYLFTLIIMATSFNE